MTVRLDHAHRAAGLALVGSSVFALLWSGEIGFLWGALGACGALGGALLPPSPTVSRRRRLAADAIGVAGVAGVAWSWLAGAALLVALSRGLLAALVARLLVRSTPRDERWVEALSFSMLIAAAGLNADLSFAGCFVVFVIAAVLERMLLHLRAEGAVDELRAGWLVAGTAVSAAALVLGLAAFLLLPRTSGSLFGGGGSGDTMLTGFSETIALGDHGTIRQDSRIVMRVRLSGPAAEGEVPHLYWRGLSFDRYENGRWWRTAPVGAVGIVVEESGAIVRVRLVGEAPAEGDGGAGPGPLLRQEIFLEPMGTELLFAATRPVAFELDRALAPRVLQAAGRMGDEVRVPRRGGIAYVAYSELRAADPWRALPDFHRVPSWLGPYLQIPREMPERVRALARRIAAGQTTVAGRVRAVADYLRRTCRYTLDLTAPPPGRDPIDHFLFDACEGHCEYFSSAMTILLRALGIPARNVNGFAGGDWNRIGGYIAVRAADAHSWVEVWTPDGGWVTVDPTPPAGLPGGLRGARRMGALFGLLDSVRLAWLEWVVAYDLEAQVELFRGAGRWLRAGGEAVGRATRPLSGLGRRAAVAVMAAALGLGLLAFAARHRKDRAVAVAPGRHPVARAYRSAVRALARRGIRPRVEETPAELARRAAQRFPTAASPLAELTALYYRVRYGPGVGTAPLAARAERLAREVRSRLSEDARRAQSRPPR